MQRLKVQIAGIISLVLMLGIARFAYTPLIPLMEQQAGLGTAQSGWLAAVNYVGYICGALVAASISSLRLKDRLYRLGLIVAILTTVGMGLTDDWLLWAVLRFFAGLSSAAGMLIGSGLVLNWLIRHGYRGELGVHFAGMGLGIAACALAVELLSQRFDWSQQWIILSLAGIVLAIPAWQWLPKPEQDSVNQQVINLEDNPPSTRFIQLMTLAYLCAGVGYVISITFIVAIAEQLPELRGQGNLLFMVMGIAAIPSCFLWDKVARKSGVLNALIIAYLVHMIGILMPLWGNSLAVTLVGAVLYGATVIGIVSMVLAMAGRFYPSKPATMMGKMTLSYGISQIFAPALTGHLAELSGNYNSGIYLAAGSMALGVILLLSIKAFCQNDNLKPAYSSN